VYFKVKSIGYEFVCVEDQESVFAIEEYFFDKFASYQVFLP